MELEEKFNALLHQHRSEREEMGRRLEQLQEENATLASTSKNLKAVLEHQEGRLKDANRENSRLTHSAETYSKMEAVLREKISSLTESKKSMQKEIRDLQVRAPSLSCPQVLPF